MGNYANANSNDNVPVMVLLLLLFICSSIDRKENDEHLQFVCLLFVECVMIYSSLVGMKILCG